MKNYILVLIILQWSLGAFCQTITPSESQEFCPLTDYSFTINNFVGTSTSIVGSAGAQVVLGSAVYGNGTVTFIGRFADQNSKQTFTLTYQNQNQPPITFVRSFVKIRSLLYSSSLSAARITPNILNINAPVCQVNNIGISFSNTQYSTTFEAPDFAFGFITTYEYLLPTGWSLNGQTSNGTIWIAGGNNVTVISDFVNGDQGCVKIRKVNPCGASLRKGEELCIPISRPLTLGISGPVTLCNSETYFITGLPANSTVSSWESSNSSTASVPNPSTGTSVVLTPVGSGRITLTANVQLCDGSQRTVIKDNIQVGAGAFGTYNYNSNSSVGSGTLGQTNSHLIPKNQSMCFTTQIGNTDLINPVWTRTGGTPVLFNTSGISLNFCLTAPSTSYASNSTTFTLTATNSCGAFSTPYTFTVIASGWSFRFATAPNPSKGNITLSIQGADDYVKSIDAKEPIIIEVMAMNSGKMMQQFRHNNSSRQFNLDLTSLPTGIYLIRVKIKEQSQTQQLVISN